MKFTTSKKLWLGFSVVIALLLVVSAISISLMYTLTNSYDEIINTDIQKLEIAEDIQIVQKDLAMALLEFVSFGNESSLDKMYDGAGKGILDTGKLIEITSDEESLKLLEELKSVTASLYANNDEIIAAYKSGKDISTYVAVSEVMDVQIANILEEIISNQEQSIAQTVLNLEEYRDKVLQLVIILSLVSIIVGTLVSYFISRSIANPVKKITKGLEQISNGNLQIKPIHIKNKDEIGAMALTYNKMLSDLKDIVTGVRNSSMELAANAEQLSASAQQSLASSQMVSVATEQQLESGLQQTKEMELSAHSMNLLNQSVMNIANDNDEMRNATSGVHSLVVKGSTVISDVANNMNNIHTTFSETTNIMMDMAKYSTEIQSVTSIIKEISEQTNLLALNASIEAAHAGEYGQGFAVVANEVKKLAEQSKQSAIEIEGMINLIKTSSDQAVSAITSGGSKVEEGLSRTNESLHVFTEIETSVFDVVNKVESVSQAVEEIKEMTERVEVNYKRVQELAVKATDSANETSAATQEQLATTEEISSNAQSLADLAEQLQSKVNHFSV